MKGYLFVTVMEYFYDMIAQVHQVQIIGVHRHQVYMTRLQYDFTGYDSHDFVSTDQIVIVILLGVSEYDT